MTDRLLEQGLTNQDVRNRLEQFGPNVLPAQKGNGFLSRLIKILKEPMLLLLILIGSIYLLTGERSEGIALGLSAAFVVAIAFYQDFKSERALEALRDLSSPRTFVIRDGEEKRIPASELVPGDLIVLHEGDRVPADGFLISSTHLVIDESLLTGEAFSVRKEAVPATESSDPAKIRDQGRIYAGTLVVGGKGFARVLTTGIKTEMGKIGSSLAELDVNETLLSKEVGGIVKFFAWTGGGLCLAITLFYGISKAEWMSGILAGLATAMSLLPEEFPVVLTVFLALGAWRLSKVQVLVRRPSATERLGAMTALCVDKTGTITLNKMSVATLVTETGTADAPFGKKEFEDFANLVQASFLASHPQPFDPMEKAIHGLAAGGGAAQGSFELIKEYPLTKDLFATSFVWKNPRTDERFAAVKGAPEAVLLLCSVAGERADKVIAQTRRLAQRGYRILGVGRALLHDLPESQTQISFEWVGLVAFEDPIRPEVPNAMDLCREAGIRVYMMTGDYPETARNIATQAGIELTETVLTGAEVESLSEDELRSRLNDVRVFARMKPDQKLRIVGALKARGDVVGMTGDGVNDAPSLKRADVGIAMGARGTDVAREAADIVLIDDNFASIVSGIERGRSIFANLKKSMSYIISIHVPIAGLAIGPVLFGWPPVLLPIHIALLELIIDPTCSLLFEAQEPDDEIMRRPPRRFDEPLFSRRDFIRCFLEGLLILGPCLLLYRIELQIHDQAEMARAVAFLFLGACNVALIVADLTAGRFASLVRLGRHKLHLSLLAGVAILLVAIVKIPGVTRIFHFAVLPVDDLSKAFVLALIYFFVASLWNRSTGASRRSRTPQAPGPEVAAPDRISV